MELPVTITRWFDYSSKYAVAYLTSDNQLGMTFKDGSRMIGNMVTYKAKLYRPEMKLNDQPIEINIRLTKTENMQKT